MPNNKYLIVFKQFDMVVPKSLREFVKKTVSHEFSSFDVELDFTGTETSRDLLVTFSRDIPIDSINGVSSRPNINFDLMSGTSTIFVNYMKSIRIQTSAGTCEPAYLEAEASLGSMIANVTIHEIGHMLGLPQDGGFDGAGHTRDPDNYMWSSGSLNLIDFVSAPFEYTVKEGDTMSGVLRRYINGTLDKCRVGPTGWTYMDAWQDPDNEAMGFVAHPTKSGVPGRRANDPNWIYPGEKIALPNNNFRTQAYRLKFRGFLGTKSFTKAQKDTMKRFIADRLAAGKG